MVCMLTKAMGFNLSKNINVYIYTYNRGQGSIQPNLYNKIILRMQTTDFRHNFLNNGRNTIKKYFKT